MKTNRWIRIVLGAAILGYLAYDLSTEIAEAHGYYSSHKAALLAVLFVAPLLGIITLVYRDKVTERIKTLHALVATTVLATAISIFATQLTWTMLSVFQPPSIPNQQKLLGALALIIAFGVAAGLWWCAYRLWIEHRTRRCTPTRHKWREGER